MSCRGVEAKRASLLPLEPPQSTILGIVGPVPPPLTMPPCVHRVHRPPRSLEIGTERQPPRPCEPHDSSSVRATIPPVVSGGSVTRYLVCLSTFTSPVLEGERVCQSEHRATRMHDRQKPPAHSLHPGCGSRPRRQTGYHPPVHAPPAPTHRSSRTGSSSCSSAGSSRTLTPWTLLAKGNRGVCSHCRSALSGRPRGASHSCPDFPYTESLPPLELIGK